MIRNAVIVSGMLLAVAGCALNALPSEYDWLWELVTGQQRPLVNVQVTEYRDPNAFARVIGALQARALLHHHVDQLTV